MFPKVIDEDNLGLTQTINFISIKIMMNYHLNIISPKFIQSYLKIYL